MPGTPSWYKPQLLPEQISNSHFLPTKAAFTDRLVNPPMLPVAKGKHAAWHCKRKDISNASALVSSKIFLEVKLVPCNQLEFLFSNYTGFIAFPPFPKTESRLSESLSLCFKLCQENNIGITSLHA